MTLILEIAIGIVLGFVLLYALYFFLSLLFFILRGFWEVIETIPNESAELWKIVKFDALWLYRGCFRVGKLAGRVWGRLKGNA
ncbi:MAG: hypothetical protein ABSC62_10790 [Terracidiphilus sp.]|jgi:hypothetical protein